MVNKIKFIRKVSDLKGLTKKEKNELEAVAKRYEFKVNSYYASLIDWSDKNDPLRRLVLPDVNELRSSGPLDPSKESKYTQMPGIQHKYTSTALFLISGNCGSICRYCFRKRIFMNRRDEAVKDLPKALNYIRKHKGIQNVLLTGGDPFMLSTEKLAHVIGELKKIPHVGIIRIGTKMTAFYPDRIIKDKKLVSMIKKNSTLEKRIYIMNHFDHARELAPKAVRAVSMLVDAGAIMANQTPIIKGVNDSAEALSALFTKLSYVGVSPYYIFQCRPTAANWDFAVPVERSYVIFEKARSTVSGLAKTARLVMSTATGKIHVIGMTDRDIIFKYFRAARHSDSGRIMIFRRNPDAYWFDDYTEVKKDIKLYKGLDLYGPD
ncbi:MAG TPA: KamA family radical SAM protein [bacterium]|nr:KamA family radical SAM protein [bacterium]